jgi:UDP-3-O-[3-hydroxymyristoyl] glucosamine N-acyltransferase
LPSVSCLELQQKYPHLVIETRGDLSKIILGISAIENIQAGSFVYITNDKYLETAENSLCTLILAPKNISDKIPPTTKKTWFLSPNPELLMSFIKKDFFLATPYKNTVLGKRASNAHIPSSCKIAESVTIAPGVVLGENVIIGENSFIGANTVIEANCKIGNDTTLHPLVYVGHSCVIGNNCEILPNTCIGSEGYGYAHDEKWNHYRIPHSGRVVLEDDVHVGANCSIDRGSIGDSVIGRGTKIDNQCHLAHNSIIGKNGLITAQFGMAGSSKIGNNFVTGGKTSVTGHITITDNVQVGGMSGVTKNISEPGQYGGFPLQKMQDYLKTKAALAKIVEMRETLRDLVKSKDK